jgi:hypothetical protein
VQVTLIKEAGGLEKVVDRRSMICLARYVMAHLH